MGPINTHISQPTFMTRRPTVNNGGMLVGKYFDLTRVGWLPSAPVRLLPVV